MKRIPIPNRFNAYGNSVINWDHWSVRLRICFYEPLNRVLPFSFWFWLERHNFIINSEPEDCWVGGFELQEND